MSSAGSDAGVADVAGLSQSRTNSSQLGSACPPGDSPVLHVGQEVSIAHFEGTIRFIGETQFATGRWVGIELKEAVGKNNGSVKGVTYFECSPQHGIFVREAVVRPLDSAAGATSARSSAAEGEAAAACPATPSEAAGVSRQGAPAGPAATPSEAAGTPREGDPAGPAADAAASSAVGAAASPAGAAAAGGEPDAPVAAEAAAEAAAGSGTEVAVGDATSGARAITFRDAPSLPPSAPASARAASEVSAAVADGAAADAGAEAPGAAAGPLAGAGASCDDGDSSGGSDVEMVPTRSLREQRRYGVSAESAARLQNRDAPVWTPPFHKKDPEERAQLSEMIRTSHDSKLQMMFGGIRAAAFEKVVDAMFCKQVPAGEQVIRYGDDGDFFYIVKAGQFDILARKRQGVEEAADSELVKVFEAGAGYAFGELALLYNAPRSATIVAVQASEVWCLEREAFRKLVVQSFEDQFREYVDFISRCDIFHELSSEQVASLAEVLEEEDFEEDEAILDQGGRDNKMFIIRRGKAVACIKGDQGEVEVMRYKEGDYFGEIALLLGEPRKANVYAVGPTTCMYITRDTFNRVLGPLRDFMRRNIGKYQKYQDAITAAQHHDGSSPSGASARMSHLSTPRVGSDVMEEVYDGGLQKGEQVERPKRYRAKTVVLPDSLAEEPGEEEAEAEVGAAEAPAESAGGGDGQKPPVLSLADKVAADFKNPLLVSPCDSFVVPNCLFHMFGGLKLGQKFTHDKVVVARSKAKPTQDGLQDTYSWKGPSWLKGNTQIAVLCQKGQKSASDPTPNQDNYFVLHVGSITVYGVCDGHGPFGHLVSFRLVQSLPHLLTENPHFGKDWALALKEAFLDAQKDLLSFCAAQDINVEASGAAGSVLVFEGPSIHVAHIGDAGAMIASWNRRDSRLIFGTKDHKPQNPEERARLEAAGSEVREIDKDSYRIYIQGTNFPGLTMSRAFGDTACAGVLQEPEYHTFFMQPGDEYYAIIASDGIWEFMEYEKVVDLSAKKLRLKGPQETARFLTEASRKRWAYCCGDYCDDITVLLVQWNVKDKGGASDENHTLTVTREE